jgi:hypothetical protein
VGDRLWSESELMSYRITHRVGGDERDPPLAMLHDLIDELAEDEGDAEHGSVAVKYESSAIEVGRRWDVVFTPDLEADDVEQFHLPPGSMDRAMLIELMTDLAEGRLDAVRARAWMPGNR